MISLGEKGYTVSTDLRAIMRRDERHRRMVGDPDLTGDALLFALVLDEVIASRREQGRRRGFNRWVLDVEERACGSVRESMRGYWVRRIIADDVPRYEPERESGAAARKCVAPMIRREGLCGKHGTNLMIDHDPETGAAQWIGLCARHNKTMRASFEARRQAWIANGKPSPPPNRGGVLCRYFRADWTELYRWAAPHLTPMTGGREPTPPRPQLRLVQDDGDRSRSR